MNNFLMLRLSKHLKKGLVFLSFLAMLNCTSNNNTIDIQGHRGCRGLLPENSLPAFSKALDLGVHTLELDLAVSKDNIVIVSHEPFLNHEISLDLNGNPISKATEKSFNLYKMQYDSIKQYDCGSKVHPRFPDQEKLKVYKPTLAEVFQLAEAKNPNIKYNIEIKAQPSYDGVFTPNPKEFVSLVLDIIKKYKVEGRTNLQSFDVRVLEEIKKQDPKMEVAILVDENESIDNKIKQLSYKPEIISPYFKLITKASVKDYQENNYKVIPWTLNTEKDIQLMIDFKVDGIITDYPNRLIALLNE